MASVTQIDYKDYVFQFYESNDESLIPTFELDTFLDPLSYIELITYDVNQQVISSQYNYSNYILTPNSQTLTQGTNVISQFNIDPSTDIQTDGYGEYVAYYNFLTKRIGSFSSTLFIKDISSDRTEICLDSVNLSNLDIIEQTSQFIQFRENSTYFVDFYLNLGQNQLIIANNIQLLDENTDNPKILIKLYEPLPNQFLLKEQVWVVTQLSEPEAFLINYPQPDYTEIFNTPLQGPNFNIPIKGQVNNSSQNLSENDILSGTPTSSLDHIESLLNEKSINISVDYTDFSDFIHFSSGKTRLENFYYKASLIEGYSASISTLSNTTSSATSTLILQNKISEIIKNFDGYDRFLYYTSGSEQTWPKTTTEPPYLLAKTGSAAVVNWLGSDSEVSAYYGGMILSASNFDNQNNDQLLKSIPEYLREDSANQQYDLFVDMVAQYYDNVWLYTKDVTNKYNADNRLDSGVSKDLVADAIKDFGLKLYQNNFSNSELYTAFLGLTPNGSLFPFPNITGSTPVPSGYELVDTMISASNDVISMDDTNKSLYKRIYHNIPYLLNTKGTIPGLRALITSYGIPDTILRISEFGGKDKVNENDWDFYFHKFNYAWDTQGTNSMNTPWEVNSNFRNHPYDAPGTVEFRFKTTGLPDSRVSQSLWFTTSSAGIDKAIVLEYTGSYLNSGSYSGSIPDPYYQYGTLKYISQPGTVNEVSCSIYLPFYNGDWWSVMVRNNGFDAFDPEYIITEPVDYDFIQSEDGKYIVRESSTTESISRLGNIGLFAANKIYNGNDGTQIGFTASSSIDDSNASGSWISGSDSHFAKDFTAGSTYQNFSGSMQEVRYYNVALGTTRFYDYTMNPLSIEGNGVNASPNELTFRAGLASEGSLEIGENEIITQFGEFLTTQDGAIYITEPGGLSGVAGNSIHPKVTGSWTHIPSFATSSTYNFEEGVLFVPNREYYFLDQFPAGIKNRITDKIRYEDSTLPAGDVLSPIRSLSQMVEASASYTDSINYLEVAFSPQNEINDDIISQIGYFNVGDYIGDPRQRSSSAQIYPDLNALSEDYFKKYTHSYDLTDFVRLIKFFDNSLFKMIKDFIPTRTSLASGLVIKQHLLERNKYPQPQVSYENKIYTGSIDMVDISGGPGGVFNELNSPPPEIIMSFQNTGLFASYPVSASLYSTIRGKIQEFDIPPYTTFAADLIEMYDGERFYLETKLTASSFFPTQLFWNITSSYGNSPNYYLRLTADGLNYSSFKKQQFSQDFTLPLGKNIVFDNDNDYIYTNYLPKDTLYKQDVNFQRWDESFPSLIGEIPKLHDNQDEFYDGEFSGSVILVTNGELNEGCEAKEVQVRPNINYQVRVYGCDNKEVGWLNVFNVWNQLENKPLPGYISIPINPLKRFDPASGFTFPNGFGTEYLKISRFDNDGFDMSPTLSQLSSIKIKFDDIGWVTYDIDTVNQQLDYYYYNLGKNTQKYGITGSLIGPSGSYPNAYTGSLAKPQYDLTGSLSENQLISDGIFPKGLVFVPCSSTEGFSNELYNSSTQNIEFNTYAQKEVHIKSVFTASTWTNVPFDLTRGGTIELYRLRPSNPPEQLTLTTTYNAGTQPNGVREHTFTQSFNQGDLLPGDIIGLGITTGGITDDNIIASFEDTKFYISSSEATVSINQVVTNPFLTSKFQNTDCDVLLGEVEGERPNPYLQDLDYQTSQTVPVNYQVVVSQSATRATVPESYYTSPSQINNRYVGSKNQSINFNIYQPLGVGGQTTTNFGNPINIGTYGQTPSVESLDINLYEFQWGGGTTPEILGWGSFKMGQILQVSSPEAVKKVDASQNSVSQVYEYPFVSVEGDISSYRKVGGIDAGLPGNISTGSYTIDGTSYHYWKISQSLNDYNQILNNNKINTEITPILYNIGNDSNPIIPKTTKIASTTFGVPSISTYAFTSSNSLSGSYGTSTGGFGFIYFPNAGGASLLNTLTSNPNGFYTDDGLANEFTISNTINASLNNNEKWFVTLFNSFEYPSGSDDYNSAIDPVLYSGSLSPYNVGYDIKDEYDNYINPLAYKGVFEIVGVNNYLGLQIILSHPPLQSDGSYYTPGTTVKNIGGNTPGNSLGMLIWKGEQSNKSQFVIVQDLVTGGVKEGAFMNKYSPTYIMDNFEEITKTYGSNKQ